MVGIRRMIKLTMPFNFIGLFFVFFGVFHANPLYMEFGIVCLVIAFFAGMVRFDGVEKDTKQMLLRFDAFFIPV